MISSAEDAPEEQPNACRVGADLRAARDRLGWSLPDIAEHLRIRLAFLEAIEEGRIRDLPGNAYAVGFVRTYGQSLGLDPDEIARRFRLEASAVNRKTELAFPVPVPQRGAPAGAVVLLGAVLAIGAYIGWYRMSGEDRPTNAMVQPVPERLAPLAAVAPASAPQALSAQAPVVQGSEVPASPGLAAAAPMTGIVTQAAAAPAIPAAPAASLPAAATQIVAPAPAADGTRIVLRAKADAWVQVRDRQGPVLLNRLMRSGETWSVPPKGQLLLTTGNAGGTELLVDGVATASLGNDGMVRRDLPLDPDMIRDGRLAPAMAQAAPARTPATVRLP